MTRRYKIAGAVADGTHYTDAISTEYSSGTLAIAFYDAQGNIVTPTGGTIAHKMELIKGQWHGASSGDEPILAANCGADASYVVPTYLGQAIKGRVTLAGITGAVSFEATFWRYK